MNIKLTRPLILDNTGLRIKLELDFIKYYKWLVEKNYYNCIKTTCPKHGSHISIVTKKLHGKNFDMNKLSKYHNLKVDFTYDNNIKIGGRLFTNFWLYVDFPMGHLIKKELGIIEDNFLGFHITICNTKNEGTKYNLV